MTNQQIVTRLDTIWAKASKLVLDMGDQMVHRDKIRLVRAICYQLEAAYHLLKNMEE